MKASMHSGRNGSARHNDRSFLRDQDSQEVAPHINTDLTEQNQVRQLPGYTTDLIDTELQVYEKLFSDALQATNERYMKQGHSERCRTIEDLYRRPQTRPEETIYQIGNITKSVSSEELHACYRDYARKMQEWSKKHHSPFIILNYAVHVDEATPHIHERRVWLYRDNDGNARIGQNKALEAAGVPLPYPDQDIGRYNNRKMKFDRMARQIWIETCRNHGIEVDDTPRSGVRHKDKQSYMESKLSDMQKELESYQTMEKLHPDIFAKMRNELHHRQRKNRFDFDR